jgi:hypothetical protein
MNKFTTLNRTATTLAAAAFLAGLSSPLQAQPLPPSPEADNPAATASGEKIVLDELVVTNTNSTKTALPVRPVSGVYGFSAAYQDIPRSITQINPQQFAQDVISSYSDFTRYSPSVNQATGQLANYGSSTMRGSLSDVYQNGVRMLVRQSNNRPFTLNAYEAADIVAGPAPVIYGPSARTAGYFNYLTKKPYFDATHGSFTAKLGRLYFDGAGIRDNENVQVDVGGPIIPGKLAYRVSYQGENVESYYHNVNDRYHDLYGTLGWQPVAGLTVDWNFEYGTFDWKVNNGLNRVTNALIRDGTDLAGPATPIIQIGTGNAAAYYSPVLTGSGDVTGWLRRAKSGNNYTAGASVANPTKNTAAGAGTIVGYVLDPTLVHPESLDSQAALNAPDFTSTTNAFNTQLRVKKVFGDQFTLLNNTIYQYYNTDTASNGGFYNWITTNTLENRTEGLFTANYSLFGLPVKHQTNTGLSYRFEEVWNVKDAQKAGYGPTGDYYDLTAADSTFTRNSLFGTSVYPFTGTATTPVLTKYGYLKGFYPYPAWSESPDNSVSPGGSDPAQPWLSSATNHTWTNSLSFYSQHSIAFDERVLLDLGFRQTRVASRIRNPQPLNEANAAITDAIQRWLPSWSGSLSYKPLPRLTTYATYANVVATNGMTTGSPTWATVNGVANKYDPANFHSVSDLREIGAKYELIPSQLVGGVSVYSQTRDLTLTTVPGADPVLARGQYQGVETNLRYQPARNYSVGVNYTYIDAVTLNQSVSAPTSLLADNSTNILGTTPLGLGNWRVTNLPRQNFTLFGSYEFASGFGVKSDLWLRSPYIANANGSVRVPAEYSLNVGLFYNQPRWTVALDFQNVTNERNFAGAATLLEPFNVQARYTYRF